MSIASARATRDPRREPLSDPHRFPQAKSVRHLARTLAFAAAAMLGTVAATPARAAEAAIVMTPPAGAYTLDKAHASFILRIDHLGFSQFTARFTRFDAKLQFDPSHPADAKVEATVDPASLASDNPPPGFLDMLHGPKWLDAEHFPEIGFRSTGIDITGPNSGHLHGDLTLHGVTRPVMLEATFNGGYAGHPMEPRARAGFSAHGAIRRSDFGISLGVPAPGSRFGVGDEVDMALEAEFTGPPLASAPAEPKP